MLLLLESLASFIGSSFTPFFLFASALIMFPSSGVMRFLRPRLFIKLITEKKTDSQVTPFRALSVALAGTLGVGNITGVASALIAGGPGSVFWMWIGAAAVTAVKYSEVALAVRYRQNEKNGFYGGAMYYISEGTKDLLPPKAGRCLASVFALFCCMNSLITGNLVQSNAAASLFAEEHRLTAGCILTAAVAFSIIFGTGRFEKITSKLLPTLTFCYMALSVAIILVNRRLVPEIAHDIFSSAFSVKSVIGGAAGFSAREAMRYGIMRGIFSNEAGCGTSPTAHASADAVSPVHQGCLGVFEVVFDTIVLCTMSAFVFLIADRRFGCIPWGTDADAAKVTLDSFGALGISGTEIFMTAAIVLFAYSTIIAQFYYGTVAIRFLSEKKEPQIIYSVISALTVLCGSVMFAPAVWHFADIIIGIMTAVNCVVIILLRRKVKECSRYLP